jgi:hypothetical protein
MPNCSDESFFCRVILRLAGLNGVPSGVEQGAWGTEGVVEGGGRETQRRSLRTVSCSVAQGRANVERAKVWPTLLMSTLLTCREGERERHRRRELGFGGILEEKR